MGSNPWHMSKSDLSITSINDDVIDGNILCVTGPVCGEFMVTGGFPSPRPVAESFDVFFDLRLNNRLGEQFIMTSL